MVAIIIRRETPQDHRRVETLVRDAFWNLYGPGANEHYLAHILRDSADLIPELNLVATIDDSILGHVMLTRGTVVGDDGTTTQILVLGPIAVDPAHQRQGIGRALMGLVCEVGRDLGFPAIALYGYPEIYSAYGFVPAELHNIRTHENCFADALQVRELSPGSLTGISGQHFYSPTYEVDDEAAATFDSTFPFKEKLTDLPQHAKYTTFSQKVRPA
jgi:predicted N-acetyltransferase YhbS